MNSNLTLSEIITIAVVILIIFGPERLPEMARRAGQLAARVREAAGSLRQELTSEYQDLAKPLKDIERDLRAAKDDIKASLPQVEDVQIQPPKQPASDTVSGDAGPAAAEPGGASADGTSRDDDEGAAETAAS